MEIIARRTPTQRTWTNSEAPATSVPKRGNNPKMQSITPITMQFLLTGANCSFFCSAIPAIPYCRLKGSFSRKENFSIFIPSLINSAAAVATIKRRMIMPIPPAASSDIAVFPYSAMPPSTISGMGARIQALTPAAIR